MNKDFNSDYLRGHIDTIILKSLFDGEKYGYEICKDIETKSQGSFILKQPSLYSALKRLEGAGLISSRWQDSEIGGKRHYYSLTEEGVKHYEATQAEWNYSYNILHNLLSDAKADETAQKTQEEAPKNDAEFLEKPAEENIPTTTLLDIQQENIADNEDGQLNFFPDGANQKEDNETAVSAVNVEELPQIEPETNEITPIQQEEKNDAEFINETILDDDNDISFSNNVYFRVKNDLKRQNEIKQNYFSEKPAENASLNETKPEVKPRSVFSDYEIKPYVKYNTQSKKTEFIKKSKFYFALSCIIGIIMALQLTVLLLVFKFCNISTQLTKLFLIIFAGIVLLIPLLSLINLAINPHKKGIIRIKNQFLFKSIIFSVLCAGIIAINIAFDLHCFKNIRSLTTMLIPAVLILNIIIEEVVYNILKNNIKFKA